MTAGGALVVVATPIGNLGDLSPRAVRALEGADVIACEDTRHTRKLLTHAGISGPRLVSLHADNERAQTGELVERMVAGDRVALVSDAGTPAISDPGERLVASAVSLGVRVEVVPGPSAVIAALVVSGLPTRRFCFEGFLPRKGRERQQRLAAVASEERTTVLYEAPHRLAETIAELADACGAGRRVVLARELTKRFEDVWRGTLDDAVRHAESTEPRGEYVIVLGPGEPQQPPGDEEIEWALRAHIDSGTDRKSAVAAVAAELGVPKRQVYAVSLRL